MSDTWAQMDHLMILLRILNNDSEVLSDKVLEESLGGFLFRTFRGLARPPVASSSRIAKFILLLQDRIGFLRLHMVLPPVQALEDLKNEIIAAQSSKIEINTPKIYSDGMIVAAGKIVRPPLLYFVELKLPVWSGGDRASYIFVKDSKTALLLRRKMKLIMMQ